MSETISQVTYEYAMAKAKDLKSIAKDMDGHREYPRDNGDGPESIAQRLRQAALVIERIAPHEDN